MEEIGIGKKETENRKKLELYFHIPFCVRKCLYCDFLSAPADEGTQNAYMEALIQETRERSGEYEKYQVDTIFIGGGTPSVVDASWIEKLMETVESCFFVSEDAEISMEVNPGTADADKLCRYYAAGVNRLSIGLQTADNEELKRIGRIHTWEKFQETYTLARKAGFSNINVDVMSALPGQTLDGYCTNLEKVLALEPQPEHISAYSLIVEEGTPFAKMQEEGRLPVPDEDEERLMYERTAAILGAAGYARYEISNYARENYSCRHNVGYWRRTDYVGFGIGAASLIDNSRFQNSSSLQDYLRNPVGCRSGEQVLDTEEQMEEFMFLGLRMTTGVSTEDFRKNFGKEIEEIYGEVIRRNIDEELLMRYESAEAGELRIALTTKGLDLSNYVMAQFLLG